MLDFVPVALLKLLLHPLLVMFVGAVAIRLGLPLDPFVFLLLVLVVAFPSANNVWLLVGASRYRQRADCAGDTDIDAAVVLQLFRCSGVFGVTHRRERVDGCSTVAATVASVPGVALRTC